MTAAATIEALVIVSPQQLDAITALIGPDKVHRCIVPENNIAAFWSDGPQIMAQIAGALPDGEPPRLKAFHELPPDIQSTVVGLAAGTLGWAQDGTLDDDYIQSALADDPETYAALLRPVPAPQD